MANKPRPKFDVYGKTSSKPAKSTGQLKANKYNSPKAKAARKVITNIASVTPAGRAGRAVGSVVNSIDDLNRLTRRLKSLSKQEKLAKTGVQRERILLEKRKIQKVINSARGKTEQVSKTNVSAKKPNVQGKANTVGARIEQNNREIKALKKDLVDKDIPLSNSRKIMERIMKADRDNERLRSEARGASVARRSKPIKEEDRFSPTPVTKKEVERRVAATRARKYGPDPIAQKRAVAAKVRRTAQANARRKLRGN